MLHLPAVILAYNFNISECHVAVCKWQPG